MVSGPGSGPAGEVHVFNDSGGGWSQTAEFDASDEASGDFFGGNVDFDGNEAAVASNRDGGTQYIFNLQRERRYLEPDG
jgi:FG-GAP repeat